MNFGFGNSVCLLLLDNILAPFHTWLALRLIFVP